jgi:hypothetical protein
MVLLRKSLIWLGRYGGLILFPVATCVAFSGLPSRYYWLIVGPLLVLVLFAIWYRERPRRLHVHPDMLPFDRVTNTVVAECINTGRSVEARVGPDGKLTIFRPMSIQAHPNLHAVRFLTMIAEPVLKDHRTPTDDELDQALRASLRGQATMDTPIDWDGMKESFRELMRSCDAMREGIEAPNETRKRIVTSFVRELSCRLDEAVTK